MPSATVITPDASCRGALVCAILLNPTLGEESVSGANLAVAASALGFRSLRIVNLVGINTRNSKELAQLAVDRQAWDASRPEIAAAIESCDQILFAWGSSPLAGTANKWRTEQINWVVSLCQSLGHRSAWMMDGVPRHPSRWRQYVGPQRGLFAQNSIHERFRNAIRPQGIADLTRVEAEEECDQAASGGEK